MPNIRHVAEYLIPSGTTLTAFSSASPSIGWRVYKALLATPHASARVLYLVPVNPACQNPFRAPAAHKVFVTAGSSATAVCGR